MKELKYLNKYFWKYKGRLSLGLLFIVISNYFVVKPAEYVRDAINLVDYFKYFLTKYRHTAIGDFLQEDFISSLFRYSLLIVAMALLRGLFLFFMRQTIIVVSRLIEYDMKNEIYAHYQTLPIGFYRKNNTGDLMSRISEDVSKVRMYIGPGIMYSLNMVVLFTFVISHMVAVNPQLTLYVLLPLPLLTFMIYKVNFVIEHKSEKIQQQLSRLSTFVQEAFSGIRVIKAFVREEDSVEQFNKASEQYKAASLSLTRTNALYQPLIIGLIGLSTILTIYLGGREVIKGTLEIGNVAEFVMYVNMLTWPVTSLGWTISLIQSAAASQKRINEFLQTKTEIVSVKNSLQPIEGSIEFRNVSFVYPDSGIQALDQVSFLLHKGETLGILGTTGSGKSTIANLICRLYDVNHGEIRIDGQDIKDFNPQNLRNHIGYVPQDIFLFSDTISRNIAFGTEGASQEAVYEAARQADLLENVLQFPDRFDTLLGERGITLSGGQKQRTSIARALLRKPAILLLDDCLSAVDTQTENTILGNLKRVSKSSTTVIISHRVSSLKLADHILVLEEGRVIERGTYQQLLAIPGSKFREVYDNQSEKEKKVEAS